MCGAPPTVRSTRSRASLALALLALPIAAHGADSPPPPAPGDTAKVSDDEVRRANSARLLDAATAPQAVVQISESELYDLPATTIPDRLRYVAGIDVYQARHGQFDVGIDGYNGINNSRVLALFDGRDFTLEEFGSVIWVGTLNLSDISAIDILKGPSSVAFGANAFGGVIDIHARQPGAHHQVFFNTSLGDYDTREADATALGPLGGGFYYKVSAGGTYLGELPAVNGETTYAPSSRTANYGNTDYDSRRFAATAGAYLPYDHRLEVEFHDLDIRQWDFVHDLDIGANHAAISQDDVGVRLVGDWGELRQIHTYAHKDYSNQRAEYQPEQDYLYSQAGFLDNTDITRLTFDIPAGTHSLRLGGEFYQWRSASNLWSTNGVYSDRSTWATVESRNHAGFLEDQWSIGERWTVDVGLRLDEHSQSGLNWSPRLAFNYRIDGNQFWRLSLSQGYRLPTPIETFIQQYYFSSDPNLRAETISEAELGWQKRVDTAIKLGSNVFYSRSNNEIWPLPLPAAVMGANWSNWLATGPNLSKQPGPFFAFENLNDPVTVLGLELNGDWRLADTPLTLFSNGTWQYFRHAHDVVYHSNGFSGFDPSTGTVHTLFAFDANLGKRVDDPPEWKANLGLRYEAGQVLFSVAGRYVSNRLVFSFANSYFNTGSPIELEELPPYVCCDISLGYTFAESGTYRNFVRLSVMDLFDSGHYEAFESRVPTLVNTQHLQSTSEIGRTVVGQLGWEF
jgi:outer membrane receptor protein involved in Fe transport